MSDGLVYTFRDGSTTEDVLTWARKFEERGYRTVGQEKVTTPAGRELWVSTIWQGLPSVFGEPNTYETAVFDGPPGLGMAQLLWQGRWYTEAQAVTAQDLVVQNLRSGWDPEAQLSPIEGTEEDLS
jgi:hypothetical protein